jgi:16S rRNA (guanine527-N7)-methyltransferase
MEVVLKYFDDFTKAQLQQFEKLSGLYAEWNEKINVISRKDIEELYERHVLHSLSIASVFNFLPDTKIIDIGTGGGFPGIPLAIMFPEVEFTLVDSINKKLKVVEGIAQALSLKNVKTHWGRVEQLNKKLYFDFAVSRAVAPLADLLKWSTPIVKKTGINEMKNGLICLKGGDLNQEMSESNARPMLWKLNEIFEEDFFETKYMVYVSR